ncbi:MAG TPA: heliorhodopsin HeR [Acidimicrobiales bacterium]|nr:heliorhodopsin HeR [Acidimicrobiales bacterium]
MRPKPSDHGAYAYDVGNSASSLARLRPYNLVAGFLHLAQAGAIVVLAHAFALPVRATYMTGPPGPTVGSQTVSLFNLSFPWAIAAFFALSALAHFTVAGPGWTSYQVQLGKGRNPYRWLEYSLSASIMIVLIAMLVGINDIAALVALVGVNASMIGFGWMQERYETPGAGLGPFWIGCIAGIVPWIAIAIYLFGPGAGAHPPGFVYGIFFSLFAFFNCFAVNQWLQYRQVGRWKDYLAGERAYVTLSLVAKSLLAWQIFASTLASNAAH